MKWVTRERPKIDRIACPWLIARFLDKAPEFLYVPAGEVLRVAEESGAIPFDVPGVELGHVGEWCSFDAFLSKYRLTDPALQRLAAIVQARRADAQSRRATEVTRFLTSMLSSAEPGALGKDALAVKARRRMLAGAQDRAFVHNQLAKRAATR